MNFLPDLMIGIVLKDKKGRIVKKYKEKGHSWTRNAWNWLFACMTDAPGDGTGVFGAGNLSAKQTGGTIYSTNSRTSSRVYSNVPHTSYGMSPNGSSNAIGIIIGSGTAAFSINDYALATLWASGTGAGYFVYGSQAAPAISYDAPTKTWTATQSREFTNSAGATQQISEVGIISNIQCFTSSTAPLLLARDVLATPIDVLDTESVTIEYEISLDFSTID